MRSPGEPIIFRTKRWQTLSTVAYGDVEIPKRYPHGELLLLANHSQFPASSNPPQPKELSSEFHDLVPEELIDELVHRNQDLKVGTLRALMKIAQLSEENLL